jgi:dienelactone hydrolase
MFLARHRRDLTDPMWRIAAATLASHAALLALYSDGSAPRLGLLLTGTVAALAACRGLPAGLTSRGQGLLLLAAGLTIATSFGAIAVTRVALGRHGPAELSGLVVLGVAGLAPIAAGAWRLVRGLRRGWRRWLALPVGLIALVQVVLPVAFGMSLTHRPPSAVCCANPADFGMPGYREVRLPTRDGLVLAGWYVPSRNGAAVATLHGSGGSRTGTLRQARILAQHGYGVLMLDARGHGRSTGSTMPMDWGADPDVPAAVDWLLRQPDVQPERIGLVGLSMGAETALSGAAADHRVRAVVAEGAGIRTFADYRALPHTTARAAMLPGVWLTMATVDAFTSDPRPQPLTDAMRRLAGRPVLLISGSDREERDANRAYAAAGGRRTRLWELPDTLHTGAATRHPAQYERRVLGFLDQALA